MTIQYWGDEPHDPFYELTAAPQADPQHRSGLTCTHQAKKGLKGLCGPCVEEYDSDPGGYVAFGSHPAGEAEWARLQAEIAQYHQQGIGASCFDPSDIPF